MKIDKIEKIDKPKVTISTWQSLISILKNNSDHSYFVDTELFFGDEAHSFDAKSLVAIGDAMTNAHYRIGLTGTTDGTDISEWTIQGTFGPKVRYITTKQMQEQGYSADLNIKAILLKYSKNERENFPRNDYQNEIEFLCAHKKRNQFIRNFAASLEGNTVILFRRKDKHGKILFRMLKEKYPEKNIFYIDGDVEGKDREIIRKIMTEEDNAILLGSFKTTGIGISITNLKNLILAAPVLGSIDLLQGIGRMLRRDENKTSANLYDIGDDFSYYKYENYTLKHFYERLKIYDAEGFKYKKIELDVKE